MKKAIITLAASALLMTACTKDIHSGFAIVIDPESYSQAKEQIDQYQQTVQSRGLKPILVIDKWGVPDSIRAELIRLHNDSKNPIEGCVLIGDIPVAMVRDAQHMASAFKMDQERFPRMESSIPSDRFYDSFDLQFDYLDKDSTRWFYYSLRADGAQKLNPTIYSARITPRSNDRGDKYEKLRRYMDRVNQHAQATEALDRVLLFGGDGNLSNSLAARMDSKAEFYEQCPWMRDQKQSVTYMDYAQEEYIKTRLENDLQRPEIDYALLSHHGDATIQYLSGTRGDLHLLQTHEFVNYHPQATMVSLDACYNGSFHLDDNIQEAYLFGQGNGTMLVLANSVNSIQDKWVNRYMGLLGFGMRAGYMAKFGTFMEFHLFGDPTYQFAKSADCGFDVNKAIVSGGDKFWLKQLDNKYAAIQNLALDMLAWSDKCYSAEFLQKFKSSEYGMVRLASLMELTRYRDDNFKEAVILGLNDENEMTQRFSVIYAGKNGSDEFITPVLELEATNNLSERVAFDLEFTLRSFDSAAVAIRIDDAFATQAAYYTNPDSVMASKRAMVEHTAGIMFFDIRKALRSKTASQSSKKNAISGIRNNPPHFVTDNVLNYLKNPVAEEDSVLQVATWEAIGWFSMSYRADDIAECAKKVSEDERFPVTVRNEALKTYNRVK